MEYQYCSKEFKRKDTVFINFFEMEILLGFKHLEVNLLLCNYYKRIWVKFDLNSAITLISSFNFLPKLLYYSFKEGLKVLPFVINFRYSVTFFYQRVDRRGQREVSIY